MRSEVAYVTGIVKYKFLFGGGLGPPCPPCSAPYALDFSYNTGVQLETDDLPLGKSYSSC